MNAGPTSFQGNVSVRMQRIKRVSQIAKALVVGVLLFNVSFILLLGQWSAWLHWTSYSALMLAYHLVLLAWFWQWFQLFRQYEHGRIFAAAAIRHIKILGVLWVIGWLLLAFTHLVNAPALPANMAPTAGTLPPGGAHPVLVSHHSYRFGFFSFDFGTGFDFGGLLAGAVIVLIAWIMDEGRKIKEEQELTV